MNNDPIQRLVGLGFTEQEARVYVALLSDNPLSCSSLANLLDMPRSTARRVVDTLAVRGALVTLRKGDTTLFAPVPATEFLDRLHREHGALVTSLKEDLCPTSAARDQDCVWTIEGQTNIMTRARDMIDRADRLVYLGILPATFPGVGQALREAIARGVQVVVYTTGHVELPGARVVVTSIRVEDLAQITGPGILLVRDGNEALIGEWCANVQARALWTRSPTIVSIAQHYLVHGGRRRFLLSSRFGQEN